MATLATCQIAWSTTALQAAEGGELKLDCNVILKLQGRLGQVCITGTENLMFSEKFLSDGHLEVAPLDVHKHVLQFPRPCGATSRTRGRAGQKHQARESVAFRGQAGR